jgi:pimeloyl-ACP methyl ester carboxylesterase
VNEVNRKILGIAVILMAVAMLATPFTSTVLAKNPTGTDMGDYTEYVGTLGGAKFVVRIPDEWNGMLVVGCHGYIPSTIWNMNPEIAQNSWMDNLPNPPDGGDSLPDALVGQGFAYAASSYGEGGFAMKKGMIRTHQLTEYVIGKFGVTGEVFIVGHSMGGAIALLLGEKYPELYDGVLDISGMRDVVVGYTDSVAIIADIEAAIETLKEAGLWETWPDKEDMLYWLNSLSQMAADMEAECGGTYADKPQHFERVNPVDNAEISIPMISVTGAADIVSFNQVTRFRDAVDAAGCSEYYKLYYVIADPPADHANRATIDAALSHFNELVDYPNNWP